MAIELDPLTRELLQGEGIGMGDLTRLPIPKNSSPTLMGLPGLQLYRDRNVGPDSGGYVASAREKNKTKNQSDAMFLAPTHADDKRTIAHEAEHLLARRQLGHPSEINTAFDMMVQGNDKKNNKLRGEFVADAVKAAPYLEKTYGLDSGYFSPKMVQYQGSLAPNLVYEMLATLASIEAETGKDLTKDPYLRKNLFKNREVREIYNSLTGLRQTRLDAKDLPPHTRQKETGSSLWTDIKDALRLKSFDFTHGGFVAKPLPGGKKLI